MRVWFLHERINLRTHNKIIFGKLKELSATRRFVLITRNGNIMAAGVTHKLSVRLDDCVRVVHILYDAIFGMGYAKVNYYQTVKMMLLKCVTLIFVYL